MSSPETQRKLLLIRIRKAWKLTVMVNLLSQYYPTIFKFILAGLSHSYHTTS